MKIKLFVKRMMLVGFSLVIGCAGEQAGLDGADFSTLEQAVRLDRDVTCLAADANPGWKSVNTFCYTWDRLAGYEVKTYYKDSRGNFNKLEQESNMTFDSISLATGKNLTWGKSDYVLKINNPSARPHTGVVTLNTMTWLPLPFHCDKQFHTVPDFGVDPQGWKPEVNGYKRCNF